MNDISEYKPTTSPYEVLVHLNDKILQGELKTFDALKQYAAILPEGPRTQTILKKAFDLQRQLYWGFFKGIGPERYAKVWNQVVVPDRTYPFAGDLKRYNSISDIYMGLIDIHGYTKFCHKNRGNISLLDGLDRMIQEDIPQIATGLGVVTRRARGDEILLLGASAEDVLETVLGIIDFFSRKAKSPETAKLKARADAPFPAFQISAGIAGGQKYTSLVITRDGDLSGDIVNTAARLQARADRISPEHNKILITTQAHTKIRARSDKAGKSLIEEVDFFNTGSVEFKGISLTVHDVVFLDHEAHRLAYREIMDELYESLDQGKWKSKIFEDAMALVSRIVTSLPEAVWSCACMTASTKDLSKSAFLARAKALLETFRAENFEKAIAGLGGIVADLALVPDMDELALEYLRSIHANYEQLLAAFVDNLDREIEGRPESIFAPAELSSFATLKKHSGLFANAMEVARTRVRGRKAIWYRVADEAGPALTVSIQSKK
jgi:class 3 adenylate cyclase